RLGVWDKITKAELNQANAKRMELIKSKKIGPEFAERRHSGAIYASRPLSALISKYSSTYSSSAISFDSNYISAELELDIDTESSSAVQNFSTSLKQRKHEVLTNFETHDKGGKHIKTSSSYP
ncbi:8107_t:CDS:2, partial [Rhizophagus irregularis]